MRFWKLSLALVFVFARSPDHQNFEFHVSGALEGGVYIVRYEKHPTLSELLVCLANKCNKDPLQLVLMHGSPNIITEEQEFHKILAEIGPKAPIPLNLLVLPVLKVGENAYQTQFNDNLLTLVSCAHTAREDILRILFPNMFKGSANIKGFIASSSNITFREGQAVLDFGPIDCGFQSIKLRLACEHMNDPDLQVELMTLCRLCKGNSLLFTSSVLSYLQEYLENDPHGGIFKSVEHGRQCVLDFVSMSDAAPTIKRNIRNTRGTRLIDIGFKTMIDHPYNDFGEAVFDFGNMTISIISLGHRIDGGRNFCLEQLMALPQSGPYYISTAQEEGNLFDWDPYFLVYANETLAKVIHMKVPRSLRLNLVNIFCMHCLELGQGMLEATDTHRIRLGQNPDLAEIVESFARLVFGHLELIPNRGASSNLFARLTQILN